MTELLELHEGDIVESKPGKFPVSINRIYEVKGGQRMVDLGDEIFFYEQVQQMRAAYLEQLRERERETDMLTALKHVRKLCADTPVHTQTLDEIAAVVRKVLNHVESE